MLASAKKDNNYLLQLLVGEWRDAEAQRRNHDRDVDRVRMSDVTTKFSTSRTSQLLNLVDIVPTKI